MIFKKEHELIRKLAKEFAEKELAPIAAEVDEAATYPKEVIQKLAKANFFGITTPTEYGGAGADYRSYVIVMEELCKKCASTGTYVSSPNSLMGAPLLSVGTDEQKRDYLTPMITGEKIGAFGLTEPGAGSDAGAIQTTAKKDGDYYILNGRKTFITHAPIADFTIVFAKTDETKGLKGISAFLVDSNVEGYSVGKPEDKMGVRGSKTSDVILENVRVHKDKLLGKENKGFLTAMKTLDTGRLGIAAQSIGIAQGAMDEATKYVKERKQFGKNLAQFQGIQFMLAEMETKLNAARLLTYNTALKKDMGLDASKDASMAKLFAAETAMEVVSKALQLHGGYGYIKEYTIERLFRDARITSIYEGTSEVQKMVIAGSLLK
ncbi:Acyl-CoA dehydrogenase [Peptoclostridium litorale DSM 5388]|uniref:Acyl-CoA dehydrogenase, short-chain specific n=1 Tax=Peptoclostridium litorale DSM 5388 TaxID=1121324 RepID=A0A069RB02_PEPLI|nr:acyl-CoA dehydrogenase [Peptoclostridium litorale]KDR94234.1 acyl-CoA dehydrogenase, short-chain specific [Peptoclostridium litorale DSM 5388]SIN82696.1 Acyl-CoA dehydrogenase [Peptoclostridium litorale DSM 5388]